MSRLATAEKQVSIWLVEDLRAFRILIKRKIESRHGWSCTGVFPDAVSMIERLRAGEVPDLLLLDLGLPGLSGEDALPVVRSIAPDLPVVVLTSQTDEEKILRVIAAGANGYLLKDRRDDSVVERIAEALEGGAPLHPTVGSILLRRLQAGGASDPGAAADKAGLSPREFETLKLMSDGLAKKEIADRMELSIHTVDTYIRGIYRKLEARSNTEAVAKALKAHIV